MRRLAALTLTLLLAACAAEHGVPPPSAAPSSVAAPAPAPPPPVPGATPLRIVATSPLVVHSVTAPASFAPPAGVQDLVFANASDGWLVTSNPVGQAWASGIWRSADGGATWRQVWSGPGVRLSRVGLLPGNGGVYAAGLRGDPVGSPLWLTSTDTGMTWSETVPKIPPPAPARPGSFDVPLWPSLRFDFVTPSVAYAAVDPENLYQQQTRVRKTTDGGRTWRVVPLPAGFLPLGGLDFRDAEHGWITGAAKGTCTELWRTGDGGQSWQPVPGTCPPFGLYAVDFVDAQHGYVAGGAIPFIGAQAGILETTDGGAHWQAVYHTQGPKAGGPITHLAFTSPTQGWAWGGTCKMGQNGPCRGETLVSHDGGRTWNATGSAALHLSAVGSAAWADQGWPQLDGLAHTTDGGRTWGSRVQPPTADYWGLSPAPGSSTIWLGTAGGTFASQDGGASWVGVSPSGDPVVRAGGGVLFSTDSPDLRVSRDDGGTWTIIRPPGEAFGVAAVAFATATAGLILLPTKACANLCIAVDRTEDGGQTWTAAATVALDGNGPRLAFSRSVALIVSTMDEAPKSIPGPSTQVPAFGVSRDGGSHWTIETLPAGDDCLAPATVGTSIWVPCETSPYGGLLLHSVDAGRTWTAARSATVGPQGVAMTDAAHGWMLAAGEGPSPSGLYRTAEMVRMQLARSPVP